MSLTLCGHKSIIALFRIEVLNYFSIPVELRSIYLPTTSRVAFGRTNESARKSHIVNRPIVPNIVIDSCRATRSWSVMVHAGICQHGRVRSSAISRQHTPMCVDIGTQYPHKHHATFTLFYSTLIPKSKILNSIKMAIFSRRLKPRLARRVKQNGFTCVTCATDASLTLLQMIPLSDPFSIVIYPKPLTTSVSSKTKSNAKHFRYLCKQKKK